MPKGIKKVAGKPRGRCSAYAFFMQTSRQEHSKLHPDSKLNFSEFSRQCSERWKALTPAQKQKFLDMAEKDKERYNLEMRDYVAPLEQNGKEGNKRMLKYPPAPKSSVSAFFWFCNEEKPKVKEMNPEYGVGEVAKTLGKMWAEMDPETRKKYQIMADRDKDRYHTEMAIWRSTVYNQRGIGNVEEAVPMESEEDEDSCDSDFE